MAEQRRRNARFPWTAFVVAWTVALGVSGLLSQALSEHVLSDRFAAASIAFVVFCFTLAAIFQGITGRSRWGAVRHERRQKR